MQVDRNFYEHVRMKKKWMGGGGAVVVMVVVTVVVVYLLPVLVKEGKEEKEERVREGEQEDTQKDATQYAWGTAHQSNSIFISIPRD